MMWLAAVSYTAHKCQNLQKKDFIFIFYFLSSVFIITPGYGAETISDAIIISFELFNGKRSKFRIIVESTILSSIMPNFWPMQFRGPAENGT